MSTFDSLATFRLMVLYQAALSVSATVVALAAPTLAHRARTLKMNLLMVLAAVMVRSFI